MATTSSASRNFPTLRFLAAPFRWFFRSRRRVLIAAAVLLAMIAAVPLWWSIQLVNLPDIGDPFDVAAFRSYTIPDDRNAFVLYSEAAGRLKELNLLPKSTGENADPQARWSKATPTVRRWVEANREAMELYRRGAERPDALPPAGPSYSRASELWSALQSLKDLALLEGSRLEEGGDMAGAWGWYRAVLRAASHVGLRGTMFDRMEAQRWHDEARKRLGPWAADPRMTPAMLRQALDDVIAGESLMPSESDTLKADYQFMDRLLTDPRWQNPGRERLVWSLKKITVGSGDYQLDEGLIGSIVDAWRFWRREPERSRRVIRLAIANWLAHDDRPAGRRPAPDPNVSGRYDFYAFGLDAPAGARALSPAALDRWLLTTLDAQEILGRLDTRALRIRERANHRALVVLLAGQLYRRDHGTDPPSEQALVGPYLKELPDDGLGDVGGAKAGGGSTEEGATD